MIQSILSLFRPNKLTNFQKVKRFMRVMGQETPDVPRMVDQPTWNLRRALIEEEFQELLDAWEEKDIVEIADALTDLLYVVYGAQVAFGIDGDACFEEVDSSNMTKVTPAGKVIRNKDGKVMKPATYRAPDLNAVLFKD